jgi:hypothetical protein
MGQDGSYCFMSFANRVERSSALPPFIVVQGEKCKQNDGAAASIERERNSAAVVAWRRTGSAPWNSSCTRARLAV